MSPYKDAVDRIDAIINELPSGPSYRALDEAMDRIAGTIMQTRAIYQPMDEAYETDTTTA